MLRHFGHVFVDLLNELNFASAEEFSGLGRSLCGDHERAYKKIDLVRLLSLFALSHVQGLVHKVGQVGDCRDRIAIESEDDNSIDEATKRTLISSIFFFCLVHLIEVQSPSGRVTVWLLLRCVERVHRGSTGLAVWLNHLR